MITIPGQTAFTFDVLGESARFLAVTGGDRAGKFFADSAASVPAGLSRRSFHRSRPWDPAAVVAFLDRHAVRLAARVKREVGNELRTGRKSG